MRSVWAVVPCPAKVRSSASLSAVAMRVSARTFEYEISPFARAAEMSGREGRQRATRSFSRAGPSEMPVRQESQWAQERQPCQRPSSS